MGLKIVLIIDQIATCDSGEARMVLIWIVKNNLIKIIINKTSFVSLMYNDYDKLWHEGFTSFFSLLQAWKRP